MKYIAKMMLALLASVTLAIPAYAWDFSASGSVSATFNQTTEKPSKMMMQLRLWTWEVKVVQSP